MLDRTIQPKIRQLDKIDIPRPLHQILPNGTPLNVINAGEQDVVRMDILFKAGSWRQSQKLQALFTHRMLREGSRKYSSSDIAEKLDYYGAWLELSNSLEYAYLTLYSLNKYFAETLEIIESIVKDPVFPEKELDTVIESNVQQYLVNRSKVDFIAHRAIISGLFGEQNPCGQFAVEEDYRKITPEVLRSFYKEYYHTGNYSIYLSGKVTDDIIHRVELVFGKDTFGEKLPMVPERVFPISVIPEKRIFVERDDALQSAVKLGGFTILRSHPDYLKLRVLITLLGGYFGSRLMSNIREDKGYTYGISMNTIQYPETGIIMVTTETANENVEPLIREVYKEIDKLHSDLVGQDELTTVKNYMIGEMSRAYESAFSLSDAWMFIQTAGLDDNYYERSLDAVKTVTVEELRELAQRYICKESLKEVIAGKKMS
ncbi:pitrilysin family protein [Bacteroides sp. 51]|uniref:M16 family metallopeptidase n=1 Tax=Bacteroides sp. 51 TaxID=2302938 RepID=UPI0013D6D2E7|nr:pitrilysin family protein [Bacteroides sp. 51]NDV81370.1 insulinase family protein [Bacteroides sp. 51]